MDERKVQGVKDRDYQLCVGKRSVMLKEEAMKSCMLEARQQRLAGSNLCRSPVFKVSQFNFVDACDNAYYTLYNRAYFVGLMYFGTSLPMSMTQALNAHLQTICTRLFLPSP